MTTEAEKPAIKLVENSPPEDVFNDIEGLRKVAAIKVTRRVVPINVTVKRPPNNVYFRVHRAPEMSLDTSVLLGDGGSDDFYFVVPRMLSHPTMLPRLRRVTIVTVYYWPGGAISLWPVPVTDYSRRTIACWKSARAACGMAKEDWVQILWNGDTMDYDVAIAEDLKIEPNWPEEPSNDWFRRLLRLAFADKIIDNPDHPYVQRLRGTTG